MTNQFLHCPVCVANIDVSNREKTDLAGGAVLIRIACDSCNVSTQVIMSWDDYWKKTHRGWCQDYAVPCRMKGNG